MSIYNQKNYLYSMKVLIIGWVWPEPTSSAAGQRMLHLIEVFHQMNMEIHFASAAEKTEHSHIWDFPIIEHSVKINDSAFDTFIKELNPNIVLFDRLYCEEYFAWKVAKHSPDSIRILDCEDLFSLRIARGKTIKKNEELKISNLIEEPLVLREIASIRRSHLNIMISKFEIDILKNTFNIPHHLIHYTPLLAEKSDKIIEFKKREGFVSIGNFKHLPNLDATQYLKKEIWPIIRVLKPDAEIKIYGAYPNDHVLQMNDPKNGFHIMGKADNALDIVGNAKVLLAPLRFGAGQKGKLLDAMISGTPSVTTSIGAESMQGDLDWNGFICDDPKSFAEKAVDLLNKESIWKEAQSNGNKLLIENFDKYIHQQALIERITDLINNPSLNTSFEDDLLNYHSFRQAEYMSKWIEEKEKN